MWPPLKDRESAQRIYSLVQDSVPRVFDFNDGTGGFPRPSNYTRPGLVRAGPSRNQFVLLPWDRRPG